jgi:uncharacterized peroxidase-related enzyme
LDEALSQALLRDFRTAPLSEADRSMLEYAVKITKAPLTISPADHAQLRGVGFDERAIVQITLIASWFNYINRVADALGVGREGVPMADAAVRQQDAVEA